MTRSDSSHREDGAIMIFSFASIVDINGSNYLKRIREIYPYDNPGEALKKDWHSVAEEIYESSLQEGVMQSEQEELLIEE